MGKQEVSHEECVSLLVELSSDSLRGDGQDDNSTAEDDVDLTIGDCCESNNPSAEIRNRFWKNTTTTIRLIVVLIALGFLLIILYGGDSSVQLRSPSEEAIEMPQTETRAEATEMPQIETRTAEEPESFELISQSGEKAIPKDIFYPLDNTTSFQAATLAITKDMEILDTSKPGQDKTYELCQTVRALNNTFEDPIVLYNSSATIARYCAAGGGTGNQLVHLFDLRFAAFAERRTALILDCVGGAGTAATDDKAVKAGRNMVQPWLSGYFPAAASMSSNFEMVMPDNYCPPPPEYNDTPSDRHHRILASMPLRYMLPLARQDFRRMAVALVGVPDKASPNHLAVSQFEQEYLLPEAQNPPFIPTPATGNIYRIPIHHYYHNGPIFPDTDLDDVAIHFRCGDVLLGAPGCGFHYVRFAEYARLISPEARTIGILTQSFVVEPGVQARKADNLASTGDRCRKLVQEGLVEYLQERFPLAKITIRNGPNETVALAFARMVMANQTLALNPSTFSLFPALTTFGMGYFGKPVTGKENRIQYGWVNHYLAPHLYDHDGFELLTFQSRLRAEDLAHLWEVEGGDVVLEWFRNETFSYGTNERA